MKKQILIGAAVLVSSGALYGQNPAEFGKSVFQFASVTSAAGNAFGSEAIGSRVVTGKPFSATEERHSIQILGDGTRIENSEDEIGFIVTTRAVHAPNQPAVI